MQASNLYTVIAREVTTDTADQMTSIIKLIERFVFSYKPAELKARGVEVGKDVITFGAKYSVASSWYLGQKLKKETPITTSIKIVDKNGAEHPVLSQENVIPAGIDRANLHFVIEGLPVSGAGSYELVASLKSKDGTLKMSGEYPFIVDLIEE